MIVECGCSSEEVPTVMQYTNYEVLVCKLGVELIGWTEPKIDNPGKLMTALSLNRLLNALQTGDCHWSKLTETAWAERVASRDAKMLAGKGKQRATCSDKGISKKRKRGNDNGEFKSAETVADTEDDRTDD